MGRFHKSLLAAARQVCLFNIFCGLLANMAMAEGTPPTQAIAPEPVTAKTADGWVVSFMPYLWVTGVTATVTTPGVSVSKTIDFTDIVSHISAPPLIGAAEARYGRFAIIADFMELAARTNIATKDIRHDHVSMKLFIAMGTAAATYRLLDRPSQSLEIGGGVRAYGATVSLYAHPGTDPSISAEVAKSKADPLFVLRYHARLNEDFGLSFYGDVGGFGVGSKLTWQVMGTLDYALTPSTLLSVGYRYLAFDFQKTGGIADMNLSMGGPIVGVKVRF